MASLQQVIPITQNQAFALAQAALLDNRAPVNAILTGTVDVTQLSKQQLEGLARGPTVNIHINGGVIFFNASLRAFMARSTDANLYFNAYPTAKHYFLPNGSASPHAVKYMLEATTTKSALRSGTQIRMGRTLQDAILIYQAGLVLGMETKVQHIAGYLIRHTKRCLLDYTDLTLLVHCLAVEDRVFRYVANNLCYRRFKGWIPDEDDFEAYLRGQPKLKQEMDMIDAAHEAGRRRAQKLANKEKVAVERTNNRVTNWTYPGEKLAKQQYNTRVNALVKKVNQAKGGTVVFTAEEGELRRELGI